LRVSLCITLLFVGLTNVRGNEDLKISKSSLANKEDGNYTVKIVNKVAGEVSTHFLGFTNDWWLSDGPFGKKWNNVSILFWNLSDPLVISLVQELSPATWRIGGTPEDTVVYEIGNPPECPVAQQGPYPKTKCLSMHRWDQINEFAKQTNINLVFGLNGMYGRKNKTQQMNTTNAYEFLKYTAKQGYPVFSFELGNELGNTQEEKEWKVLPDVLAKDVGVIRSYIDELWEDKGTRKPLMVGPDCTPHGFTTQYIQAAASFINATTYHHYSGSGESAKLFEEIQNASWVTKESQYIINKEISDVNKSGVVIDIWGGEIGPAYHGGRNGVTNRFVDVFWYLDMLGSMAAANFKYFMRSTLCGGDYELLNRTTNHPNPDYFVALMWNRIMSNKSLALDTTAPPQDFIIHAMCSKTNTGSPVLVLLNMQNSSSYISVLPTITTTDPTQFLVEEITISVSKNSHTNNTNNVPHHVDNTNNHNEEGSYKMYQVRAHNGDLSSELSELFTSNGSWKVLKLDQHNKLPSIDPVLLFTSTLILPPYSYTLLVLPFNVTACM